jgi:WD40 repeat protein
MIPLENKIPHLVRFLPLLLIMGPLFGCQKQSVIGGASPAPVVTVTQRSILLQQSNTLEPTFPVPSKTATSAQREIPTQKVPTPTPPLPTYQVINKENFNRLQKVKEVRLPIFSNLLSQYPNQIQLVFPDTSTWVILPVQDGIQVIDLEDNSQKMDLSPDGLSPAGYIISPDNHFVGDINFDEKIIKIWDLSSRKLAMELPYLGKTDLNAIGAFSNDNRYLVVAYCVVKANWGCTSAAVNLYDLERKEMIWEIRGNQAEVRGIGFSGDQNLIMTGFGEKIRDADLLVWDFVENRKLFEASSESERFPLLLAANGSNHTFLTFPFLENRVTLWDENNWEKRGEVEIEKICCVKFLPGTSSYVIASEDGKLLLGTSNSGSVIATTDLNWVINLFVSPDGRFIYLVDAGGLLQKWGVVLAMQ